MFQTKVVEESKHTICIQQLFVFENRATYETMWRNFVEQGSPQMAIWRMRIACWITNATHTRYM